MQQNKFRLKKLFKAIIKSIIYLFFSFVILRLKMLIYINMQNYKQFFSFTFFMILQTFSRKLIAADALIHSFKEKT